MAVADDLQHAVLVGHELLALDDRMPEQEQDIFKYKRTVIQGLVKRVEVSFDKMVKVQIAVGLEDKPAESGSDSLPIIHAQTNVRG